MDVIQVAALAVAGVLLAVQFKSGKAEYGIYLGAALSILIFFQIILDIFQLRSGRTNDRDL